VREGTKLTVVLATALGFISVLVGAPLLFAVAMFGVAMLAYIIG
jgi:hypothetical protein